MVYETVFSYTIFMTTLFIGLIPLIIFAIIDSKCNLKIALLALGIATIIECIYTVITIGSLDAISLLSIGCVVILALLSYQKQSSIFIKLKPTILNGALGLFMLFQSILGAPLFLTLVNKYPQLIPVNSHIFFNTPVGTQYLTHTSFNVGIGLLFHALLVAYAGLRKNNIWWVLTSTIGFIMVLVIAIFIAAIQSF